MLLNSQSDLSLESMGSEVTQEPYSPQWRKLVPTARDLLPLNSYTTFSTNFIEGTSTDK